MDFSKKNNSNVRIGILGGIGPLASARFYSDFILEYQRRRLINSNEDYPEILLLSIPAPELFGSGNLNKQLSFYLEGIRRLCKSQPDFIVIVCNSIYGFIDQIRRITNIEIPDLPKLISKKLPSGRGVVLGSSTTQKMKLYAKLEYLELDDSDQVFLDNLIKRFNSGTNIIVEKKHFEEILEKYVLRGAEFFILACTELSCLDSKFKYKVIDTFPLMIDEAMKVALRKKEEKNAKRVISFN